MDTTRQSILEAALKLQEEDRAALMKALLASLVPNEEAARALTADLEARLAELEESSYGTLSWSKLKRPE